MKFLDRFRPALAKLAPAAKVVKAATGVLGALAKPTPIGVANAIASTIQELDGIASPEGDWQWYMTNPFDKDVILSALVRAGCSSLQRANHGPTIARTTHHHYKVSDATVAFANGYDGERDDGCTDVAWFAAAMDAVLPRALSITPSKDEFTATALDLGNHPSDDGAKIWARTMPMLGDERCILLEGVPGSGKTTAARAIGRLAELGRVVSFDIALWAGPNKIRSIDEDVMSIFSIGVAIVDDVDKCAIPLATLEMIRRHSRLVILTANNGSSAKILDGALMRPGRVDEVFHVEAGGRPLRQEPPFDQLSPTLFAEVVRWPIAYQVEIGKRLRSHPDDLRIEDLRDRLLRKTNSHGDT